MPMVLLGLQSAATLAASTASVALAPLSPPRAHRGSSAVLGSGLVLIAASSQALQLGLSVRRRADSLAGVAALSLTSMALCCAGAFALGQSPNTAPERLHRVAAALLGVGWLSHIAAMAAQVNRDEMAWGQSSLTRGLVARPAGCAALGGIAASMAIGGVALLTTPASEALAWPLAYGALFLAVSSLPASLALTGALRHIDGAI